MSKFLGNSMNNKFINGFIMMTALLLTGCTTTSEDDNEAILDTYVLTIRAFSREDIRGVMRNISRDFQSKEEDQTTYDEVYQFRRLFILNNSNVSVSFTEISINIEESIATVSLKVNVRTDQTRNEWGEIDTLHKRNGKWEIVSWNRIESR